MDKKGQFFLLAAVIVSAVIISLGASLNKVTTNDEPDSFYDFSYEVKREVGAFLDYEVYSGFNDETNLSEFVDLLAEEAEERNLESDFIFIYGGGTDSSEWNIRNYGSVSVYAEGEEIRGLNEEKSRICFDQMCQNIENIKDFDELDNNVFWDLELDRDTILIEINGNEFFFPLSDYQQVIFVMQKDVDGNRYIVVE